MASFTSRKPGTCHTISLSVSNVHVALPVELHTETHHGQDSPLLYITFARGTYSVHESTSNVEIRPARTSHRNSITTDWLRSSHGYNLCERYFKYTKVDRVPRSVLTNAHTHTHPRHGHDTHQRSGQRRRSRNQVHNDRFLASRRLTATLIKLSNRSFSPHHHHTPTVSWALRGLQKEPSELHAYIAATSPARPWPIEQCQHCGLKLAR